MILLGNLSLAWHADNVGHVAGNLLRGRHRVSIPGQRPTAQGGRPAFSLLGGNLRAGGGWRRLRASEDVRGRGGKYRGRLLKNTGGSPIIQIIHVFRSKIVLGVLEQKVQGPLLY